MRTLVSTALAVVTLTSVLPAQNLSARTKIPRGATVFVLPMDGFETYLLAAFTKKKTPVVVVQDVEQADFEIDGRFERHGRNFAEQFFLGKNDLERAAVGVKNRKTGVTAFTYAVEKDGPWKSGQSAAEACAKHLKDWIEKDK